MTRKQTKSLVLLQHHLKNLRLPTILRECEKIAARCATVNVDHLGFLLQLCELELIERERRAAERRLKAAKFPTYKTLETFDFQAQPGLNKLLVSELMRGEFIEQRENILLVGNSGTGKTHLAVALGIAACGQGKRVRFYQVTELITQLMEAREQRELTRLKKQIAKLDLLTGATLDRLTHRCHILETTGESYRLQDAKRRHTKSSSKRPLLTK